MVEMISRVTDYFQGIRNCSSEIIPFHCAGCVRLDRRPDDYRNSLKPRCPEPNFLGTAVLEGLNDRPFDHQNINNVLYWQTHFTPPFHCICGKHHFQIEFQKVDKFHYPIAKLTCKCSREKQLILFAKEVNLSGPWLSKRIRIADKYDLYDLPEDKNNFLGKSIECACGRNFFEVYFENSGFSFFPHEGGTLALCCKRCKKLKKIFVNEIDETEPWILIGRDVKVEEILVRHSQDQCPDVRQKGEKELVCKFPLPKLY